MACIRLGGAARAATIAFVLSTLATTGAAAQSGPLRSSAAAVWRLRSGLNVAALACRGADEAAIVAGYNRLLGDHRAELATAYAAVAREHRSPAAFDAAMTQLYNQYAQPAAQAALCANALGVLDAIAGDATASLDVVAEASLARLDGRLAPMPVTQVAMAAIPQVLDQRDSAPADAPVAAPSAPAE